MASTNSIRLTYAPEGSFGKAIVIPTLVSYSLTVNGAESTGAETVDLAGGTGAETILEGSVIYFARHGGAYRVTADNLSSGGAFTDVPFEPPLRATLVDTEVVTVVSNHQTICYTGESLASGLEYVESDKVVEGGDVSELLLVDSEGGGTIDAEFGIDVYEDFMEAVLRSRFVGGGISTAANLDIANVAGTIWSIAGRDLSADITFLAIGDYVRLSGFNEPGNNTIVQIANTPGDPTQVEDIFGTMAAEMGGAVNDQVELGGRMTNGTDQHSFEIEKVWTDITNDGQSFSLYKGQVVNQWDLTIPAQERIRSTFTFTGQQEEVFDTSQIIISPAETVLTPTAVPTFETLLASTNLKGIAVRLPVSLTSQKIMVTEFSVSITPNAELRKVAGEQGAFDYVGRITNVTGSMTLFLDDVVAHKELYEAFVNDTVIHDLMVWFGETDVNVAVPGKEYLIEFEDLKISTATKPAPGKGQSVFLNVDFQSYADTSAFSVRINRFDGV